MSPSRAKDFMQCPLMFRLRTIDRIPDPGSLATHKGTLVHSVLERLYDLPAHERTREAAHAILPPRWEAHRDKNPAVMDLFESLDQVAPWLSEAEALIDTYFQMENPARLEPAERELFVQTETKDGLMLRGFVDRLDIAPDGAMRVVDYKTGRSPGPRFQAEALFQMRFYAASRHGACNCSSSRMAAPSPTIRIWPSWRRPRPRSPVSGMTSRIAPPLASSARIAPDYAIGASFRRSAPSSAGLRRPFPRRQWRGCSLPAAEERPEILIAAGRVCHLIPIPHAAPTSGRLIKRKHLANTRLGVLACCSDTFTWLNPTLERTTLNRPDHVENLMSSKPRTTFLRASRGAACCMRRLIQRQSQKH